MSCPIHNAPDDKLGSCLACQAGSPPDLGLSITEEVVADEHIS